MNDCVKESSAPMRDTHILAAVSVPVLFIYAAAQASVALVIAPANAGLKLVLEPYLLLLGLILHVQWRRVSRDYLCEGLPRPYWIIAADCLSFVITFWALGVLFTAFLQQAKLI